MATPQPNTGPNLAQSGLGKEVPDINVASGGLILPPVAKPVNYPDFTSPSTTKDVPPIATPPPTPGPNLAQSGLGKEAPVDYYPT